jgi:hypothetical protein
VDDSSKKAGYRLVGDVNYKQAVQVNKSENCTSTYRFVCVRVFIGVVYV